MLTCLDLMMLQNGVFGVCGVCSMSFAEFDSFSGSLLIMVDMCSIQRMAAK